MRFISFVVLFAILALGSVTPTRAAAVDINLNNPGGLPGTGGFLSYNPGCYCGGGVGGIYSPIYLFAAGTVVDFGSLEIPTIEYGQSTPDGGPTQPYLYLSGAIAVSFSSTPSFPSEIEPTIFVCSISNVSCNANAQAFVLKSDLTFTIPQGADSIQIEWVGPTYTYTPPVPEPSTWAMLLIGFAGVGFAAYRKRRHQFPNPAGGVNA